MSTDKNETTIGIKRTNSRYIMIRENIYDALDLQTMSLYTTFRYQSDFSKEDAIIKRSSKFLYEKAKISRRQFFKSLNILENEGLVLRDTKNALHSISTYHVAQELGYFNTDCGVVHEVHGVVHEVHTDHYSSSLKENTNSEFDNSPAAVTSKKPKKTKSSNRDEVKAGSEIIVLRKLIEIYCKYFPDNPQPHSRVISTSLERTLRTFVKRWPEADPEGKPLTYRRFETYMETLKADAPRFSQGTYVTDSGREKKNGLETFTRWNTFVKFLEGSYS